MLYLITRASDYLRNENKPCKTAFKTTIDCIDERNIPSFEEYDKRLGSRCGTWLSKGTNHRINDKGHIERVIAKEDVWAIEINTIEELEELMAEVGDIIIGESARNHYLSEIIIYDDYVED